MYLKGIAYTNPGLCHLYQDDIEGGREGFCDRLSKAALKSNKTNAVIFPSFMADKMSLLMRRIAVSVP